MDMQTMDPGMMIAIGGGIYFLPTIVALLRWKRWFRVFLVNLAFGWSIIGWMVAMIIALWPSRKARPDYVPVPYFGDVYDHEGAHIGTVEARARR